MKVSVTGASGFIGSVLCRALIQTGHEALGMVNSNPCPVNVPVLQGSILDPAHLDILCRKAEVLFHVAGKISIDGDPDGSVWRTNVEGTEQVVSACVRNGVKRLVYLSSIHAMQHPKHGAVFNETAAPANPAHGAYGASKAAAERVVTAASEFGLEVIILNPTAVIGPLDHRPSATGKALLDLLDGRFPILIKGGYDFVDVRDVAQTAVNAVTMGRTGERYILSGHYLSVKRMTQLVDQFTGVQKTRVFLPNWVQWLGLPFVRIFAKMQGKKPLFTAEVIRTTSQGHSITSRKAQRELNHNPRPVERSVADAIVWMHKNFRNG